MLFLFLILLLVLFLMIGLCKYFKINSIEKTYYIIEFNIYFNSSIPNKKNVKLLNVIIFMY